MQNLPPLITDLALILAVAAVVTIACRRLKLPLVVGYVLAGFLVGPAIAWVPTVVDTASITTWSDIGVIFLMFGLGLEFSVLKLTTVGRPAVVTAATEMSLMIALGLLVGTLLGWPFVMSLFLGGMLAISSSSIIVKTFTDLGIKGQGFTELVFGVLVIEDIAAVFLLAVLSTAGAGAGAEAADVVLKIGRMALYLIVWFALSVIVVPSALKRIRDAVNDEILLVASIALCFGMAALAVGIGFSSALGAFLAGSILAGTVQAPRIAALFKPLKDLFGAVFFVSVGMLVAPQAVIDNLGTVALLAVVTVVGRSFFCCLGALLSGQSLRTAVKAGLSLAQIGEFSFIIAALGTSLGVTAGFLYPVIVTVSVVTSLASPLLVRNSERAYLLLVRLLPASALAFLERREEAAEDEGDDEGENLWRDYLKRWFFKAGLVVLCAAASVEVLVKMVPRLLRGAVPEPFLTGAMAALGILATGLFMANLFYTGRKNEFGALWMRRRRNRPALAALSAAGVALSFFSVLAIAYAAGADSIAWMVLLGAACTVALGRSRTLHSLFLKLETSFTGNLKESVLAERRASLSDEDHANWVEKHLYVVEVEASRTLKLLGAERSTDVVFGIAHNLDLMAIVRDGRRVDADRVARLSKEELARSINDPNDTLGVREGDVLAFLGTEAEVDAYLQSMLKDGSLEEDEAESSMLDDYLSHGPARFDVTCFALGVEAGSPFAGKTIASIDFKGTYASLVVAHEHEALVRMKPSRNTRLFPGDRVWLVGDPARAAGLIEQA
ncbi:sodium:proton exchanger [Gordonibacter sp. 28C]|uniref:cation:proton antiporter domain-containing protein n=1 Tax=Gordonibacter sp. 28C TaxID=2078569 RepID=UPI000DF79B34|nr:cation:proton antiporter [Gordonibacter sp. 28C]RDB61747.1 sodium:proton exchanger [Gordonibacter sp. 28C]